MGHALRNITHGTFRASPDYELVSFERLAPGEQARLSALREDPDLYGVLKPRGGSARSLQSVGQDTALLLLTLQSPGPLPAYVHHRFGPDCAEAVARLVLAGVLELRVGEAFVGGADAHAVLQDEALADPGGPVARLSLEALRYGQALGELPAQELALRLYLYNTAPFSPGQARALPDARATEAYLGLGPGGRARRWLDEAWAPVGGRTSPWWSWRHHEAGRLPGPGQRTWKLYVSPRLEALPEAFETTVRVFTETSTPLFKVGAGVRDLLRPDKLVAYFPDRQAVEAVGARLSRELAGLPAQGVPFTADVGDGGLVSLGADPPEEPGAVPWLRGESWRLHVVHRLAAALLLGRGSVAPWRFALDRVWLDGIDPTRWLPRVDGAASTPFQEVFPS